MDKYLEFIPDLAMLNLAHGAHAHSGIAWVAWVRELKLASVEG